MRRTRAHIRDELPIDPILESVPHASSVVLQGIAEPLTNPDLPRIIARVHKRMPSTGQIGTTTNAVLLGRDVSARLFDEGLSWISFSMDGASKSVYEGIRRGATFERVLENVADAVECGKGCGRKDVAFSANFVIMEENVHEIPEFARLAISLGLDSIYFNHRRDYAQGGMRILDEDLLKRKFEEAKEIGAASGLGIVFSQAFGPQASDGCGLMQMAYVWFSGDLVACSRMVPGSLAGRRVQNFGNVKNRPLVEIWNSPEFKEFRRDVLAGAFPGRLL